MNECDLTIQIVNENGSPQFVFGDRVELLINIQVHKTFQCKKIETTLFWKTHGRGNIDKGSEKHFEIPGQEFTPGFYSFKQILTLPLGPASFHGKFVNLDWYINVCVAIPWARDIKRGQDFILKKPEDQPEKTAERELFATSPAPKFVTSMQKFFFGAAAFFPFLGFFFLRGLFYELGALGLFSLLLAIIQYLKPEVFGEIIFDVNPSEIVPKQKLNIGVLFTPSKSFLIHRISVTLIGEEKASSGTGTNIRDFRNVFFSQEHILSQELTTLAKKEIRLVDTFSIPSDLDPTADFGSNAITWYLVYRIFYGKNKERNYRKEIYIR